MSKNKSKTTVFLIELLIAVMFLAVCCAVCLKFFSAAHSRSEESRRLNNASVYCSSAAEAFKSTNGDKNATASLLGGVYEPSDDTIKIYYDAGFTVCGENEAEHCLCMRSFEAYGNIINAVTEMSECKSGEVFFDMTVSAYNLRGAAR